MLVDDVNDSGKTLQSAVDHIAALEPANLKTAVLHEKANTAYATDFYGKKLEEWEWLIYQWAAAEDILEFLRKDEMLNRTEETARNHLAEEYDLSIGEDLFHKIIDVKDNYLDN